MPFEPLKLGRSTNALTIDVKYRLRASAGTMKELGLTTFTPIVVSVDVENKRIGIAKQELAKVPNSRTVRPDKRGYLGVAAGKEVCAKLALTPAELPCRFESIGKIDEGTVFWNAFEFAE